MHLTRLFSVTLVVAIAIGTMIPACGGDSSSHGMPDAKVFNDARVFLDAPPAGSAAGLGKLCTGTGSGDPSLCPSTDSQCVTLNTTTFFCTKTCGTAGSAAPPTNGSTICATGEMTPGTPLCALRGAGSGSAYPWSCGIGCGMYMTTNLGTCPSGLTCTSNICQ